MSLEASLKSYRQCFIDLAWAHWNRLGATGFGDSNLCSVDPEALLMLTSIVGREEGRLMEIMSSWLAVHEGLISIERLKNLIKILEKNASLVETPEAKEVFKQARLQLRNAVFEAVPKKQILRWKKVFLGAAVFEPHPQPSLKKIRETEWIVRHNFLARLRYHFGPGTRADILYYALVLSQQKKNPFGLVISAPMVSRSLAYNLSSVHRTLGDFEKALVLKREASGGNRAVYRLYQAPYEKNRVSEKCFINWFPIVGMAFWLERLVRSLEVRPASDESIVKSRLWRFIFAGYDIARDACIPLGSGEFMDTPTKDVPLEAMLRKGEDLLREIYDFVTSQAW